MTKEIKQVLRSFDGLDNSETVTQVCKDFAGTFQEINKKNFSRYVELLRNTALVPTAKKVPANEKGFLSFEVSGNDFFHYQKQRGYIIQKHSGIRRL